MCELLGISSNVETNIKICMQVMAVHSKDHSDGWGVAYYPDDSKQCCIFKEPRRLQESKLAAFLNENNMIHSKIILNHIRKSKTTKAYENTHPFCRELFGEHWVMIHNGGEGLDNYFKSYLTDHENRIDFVPFGTTGSDKAFCIILNELKEKVQTEIDWEKYITFVRTSCSYSFETAQKVIYEECLKIMESGGDFNMIMSNGEYLIAFYSGYNHLHYTFRCRHTHGKDTDYGDFESDNLEKGKGKKIALVATEPLTEEDEWIKFSKGEFLVFKNGELAYRNGNMQKAINLSLH